MTIIILSLVLLVLLLVVGGNRGLRTAFTLVINFTLFIALASMILAGINPVLSAVIISVAVCVVTLLLNTGLNAKSLTAFISVVVTVVLMWFVVGLFGRGARIEGFSFQKLSDIAGYSWIINIDMGDLAVACILVGLIGAIVDTSIAVVSAQFEVSENNPDISFVDLMRSGIRVGRDLLGTTCNTLFFAYLGGYMTLLIWFCFYKYSFAQIINSGAFAEEFIRIVAGALGCVIIMPITALFGALVMRTRFGRITIKFDELKTKINMWLDSNPYSDELQPDNDLKDEDERL